MNVLWAVIHFLLLKLTTAEMLNVLKEMGKIQVGSVLKKSSPFFHPRLFLAIDNEFVVSMPRETNCFVNTIALEATRMTTPNMPGFRVAKTPPNYDPKRSIRLANALLGRRLPYASFSCNEFHWMNYIVWGKRHVSQLNDWCPLARPLDDVGSADITLNFALYDRKNSKWKLGDMDHFFMGNGIGICLCGAKNWPRPDDDGTAT